ncbi:MAG: DegT/DnrJ/EryC1/StrS family aminotransferase, partial [Oligoflexia bacterium]|nr:DegT/DnrJ/EryC1/StrS family aminotransferase [Oligoflexia bacterium]
MPLLDLKAQYQSIKPEIDQAISVVLTEQNFILGKEVDALEKEIAEYCKCTFAVGVSSGTDALLAGLMALGVGPGDEVVTSAYSFVATVSAIVRSGATPVLLDIEPRTFNLDMTLLEKAVSARTKAVIPVHLFGQMADMTRLHEIARSQNLLIIEDAAQAIGAEVSGKRAGAIGDLGTLSFFPSKNLGGYGDGGMIVTNSAQTDQALRLIRNHGQHPKYYSQVVGGNFRLDAMQAAILRVKLRHLESWTAARQRNAERYENGFKAAGLTDQIGGPISLPARTAGARHVFNQFVIRARSRDQLKSHLSANGIGSEIYYPLSLHLQECFKRLKFDPGAFPESVKASNETLALPIYPELTEAQQERIVHVIKAFYQR